MLKIKFIQVLAVYYASLPLAVLSSGNPNDYMFKDNIISIDTSGCTDRLPYQQGWPVILANNQPFMGQSLNAANLDPSDNEKELALFDGNILYVWNHDGTEVPGWGISFGIPRGCSINTVDDNSLIAFFTMDNYQFPGAHLYDQMGNILPGWPIYIDGGVCRSPIWANMDHDEELEIIGGSSQDDSVYVWNQDGTTLQNWPVRLSQHADGFAAGDINNDGEIEIVFSNTIWVMKKIWVMNSSAEILNEWIIPAISDTAASQSATLADMDNDGDLEILVALDDQVSCFQQGGHLLWSFFTGWTNAVSQLAVADVDNDGDLEIAVASRKKLFLLNSHGNLYSDDWPRVLPTGILVTSNAENSGPAIADIDGDSIQEIIICAKIRSQMWVFAFESNGRTVRGFPHLETDVSSIMGTPVILDLDNDGDIEIGLYGRIGYDSTKVIVYDLPSLYDPEYCDWPMLYQNSHRTNCLPQDDHFQLTSNSDIGINSEINPLMQRLTINPNPFNQRATLDFALPSAAQIKLTVYDITGREVAKLVDGYQTAGNHEIIFDAQNLVSGVYFVRLKTGGFYQTQKVLLIK